MRPLRTPDQLSTQSGAAPRALAAFHAPLAASATLQLTRLCMNHALQRTTLAVVQHRGTGTATRLDQREPARAGAFLRRQTEHGLCLRRRTARPQTEDKT